MRILLTAGMILVSIIGCGGEEEFNQPLRTFDNVDGGQEEDSSPLTPDEPEPAANEGSASTEATEGPANEPTDMPADESAQPTDGGDTVPPNASDGSTDAANKEAADPGTETTTDGTASDAVAKTGSDPGGDGSDQTGPAVEGQEEGPAENSATTPPAMTTDDGAASTPATEGSAGGKADEPPQKSGGSLLGNLLQNAEDSNDKKRNAQQRRPTGDDEDEDDDRRRQKTRFGRLSMTPLEWQELVYSQRQRFFIDADISASFFAATAGEREIRATHFNAPLTLAAVQTQERRNAEVQELTESAVVPLREPINSVTAVPSRRTIIIAGDSGELHFRSWASPLELDRYAQDLSMLLDEYRGTAKVSESPVVLVHALTESTILTVDFNGVASLWDTDSLLVPAPELAKLDKDALDSAPPVMTPQPRAGMDLATFEILDVTVTADGKRAAIVTADEKVTVFGTEDGQIVTQFGAEAIDDSLPTSATISPDAESVLVGAGDGRVFVVQMDESLRPEPAPRASFDDLENSPRGNEPNAEIVQPEHVIYAPGERDQNGAITCIGIPPDGKRYLFGRQDGSVLMFSRDQTRVERIVRDQKRAIVAFLQDDLGTWSMAMDRTVQVLEYSPELMRGLTEAPDELTLRLADDPTATSRTRRRSRNNDEPLPALTRPAAESSLRDAGRTSTTEEFPLASLRDTDPMLTVLKHQLRVAATADMRQAARLAQLKYEGRESTFSQPSETAPSDIRQIGEVTTPYDFANETMRRIVMDVTNDGYVVAASLRYSGRSSRSETMDGIRVFDTPTGTTLRWWAAQSGCLSLNLNAELSLAAGSPSFGALKMSAGDFAAALDQDISVTLLSPAGDAVYCGLIGIEGAARPALARIDERTGTVTKGLESFEAAVGALCFNAAGDSLFVSLRERDQTKLLELDPLTFEIKAEISREPLSGSAKLDQFDPTREEMGAVYLMPSKNDRTLVVWGEYQDGPELRVWKKTGEKWPVEQMKRIPEMKVDPEREMTGMPFALLSNSDAKLAMVSEEGVGVINLRSLSPDSGLPLVDVGRRRPVTAFSPNGKWIVVGDGEGKIYAVSLYGLDRKPIEFKAHTGPIAGLAFSPDGTVLATAGEDQRIRTWAVAGKIKP